PRRSRSRVRPPARRPPPQRAVNTPTVRIRRLAYADLPQVIGIERRAFPTPWSLAMFVLELSKPGGACLAAVDVADDLLGYVVCSKFADAWHLMNIAVDPERLREGIGTALLVELLEQVGP